MSGDLLNRLAAAGTPMELIMEVAETLAEARAAERLLEKRREKDRLRKRNSVESAETAESVESVETPSPQSPPLKSTPDPEKITPPLTPQPIQKRACRLPDNWWPEPLTGKALAMTERWAEGELSKELAKFKNYWMGKAGKDAAKLDWQRTWINWLISADERKPRNGQSQRPPPRTRPNLTDIIRATSGRPDIEGGDGTRTALPASSYG